MNTEDIYAKFIECNSVITDTRKIIKNDLFFALKGDKFDANTFAKEALEKGAKYVIIDNKDYYIDNRTILVSDTLNTLQKLANFHRRTLKAKIIALTGSNGKTTTKELINCVLSKKFKTIATIGNLNNHIGVPLTLLSLTKETEIGIIEMGANHKKEIEFLCGIAEPDYGYITNFGKAHLEGFGGVEGVIEGKSELYKYIQKENKELFVNLDDELQNEKTKNSKRYTFSTNKNSDVVIKDIIANPMVEVNYMNEIIKSNLIGIYNANNINAAITIGNFFSVESNLIKEAIENYIPTNNRSQLIQKNNNQIILDAYNANPSSMNAAIENFAQLNQNNKIIIFGDMFELGLESLKEHEKIVAKLNKQKGLTCYFIGNDFYSNKINKKNFYFFDTFENFTNLFIKQIPKNGLFLIKGSRGMALERVLELL
ncbi:UDP-N-acetylmuramoyl-tripeptide--D-alanyl-D-alanine ligase [Flavobacterium jejuense]|uniref:UDP-N-acetylmuramoyl-tripeptide--D-alanyl-D-alanine ligase n=1 Tax=Flavobacterium jejuense TaxID=1544455 RepID=A0ABX0IZN4_9FLAO|nr:UDP-N-acetylmuramoyl-tripeptide--D-alanyl-D-alanine ligase [Flavobacterium jejuense]NHN27219.1 UDP-N-acetylmuramoyl-tripeptide--D-alanyl-D-alanine ligase [Flavobacterium jejuense]